MPLSTIGSGETDAQPLERLPRERVWSCDERRLMSAGQVDGPCVVRLDERHAASRPRARPMIAASTVSTIAA